MMTTTGNANRTDNVVMGICPVTGERERRPDCVLGWKGRNAYEAAKSEAMANGESLDIFNFAASEGAQTIARLGREAQRKHREEDNRLEQIRGYAETQVAEELRAKRTMYFADERNEKVDNLAAKLAAADQPTRKIQERAKKLERKIQLLQTYLQVELPRMRSDARRRQMENWFADAVREPGRMPEMAVVA